MNGESIARAPLCRTCRNMEFAPLAEAIRHGLRGPHAAYMQFRSDHAVPTALLCHYGTHLIMALFTCQSPRLAPYYSVKTRSTDILHLTLPEKCKCLLKLYQELNRGLNARHRVSCVCTRHAARHAACSLRLWPGNATRCCMPAIEPDLPTTSTHFYFPYFPATRIIYGHRASHSSLTVGCILPSHVHSLSHYPHTVSNPSLPPNIPVSGRYGCHMSFNLSRCRPRLYGIRRL